jgi:hypothetical protein
MRYFFGMAAVITSTMTGHNQTQAVLWESPFTQDGYHRRIDPSAHAKDHSFASCAIYC